MSLHVRDLNEDEAEIWGKAKGRASITIAEMSDLFGGNGNSRARNALRRLVRGGFLKKVERGTYAKDDPVYLHDKSVEGEARRKPKEKKAKTSKGKKAKVKSKVKSKAEPEPVTAEDEDETKEDAEDEDAADEKTDVEESAFSTVSSEDVDRMAHEFMNEDEDHESAGSKDTRIAVAILLLGPPDSLSSTRIAEVASVSRGYVIPRLKRAKKEVVKLNKGVEVDEQSVRHILEAMGSKALTEAAA